MNEIVGWKAASNGAHKRNWFVMHHEERRYYMNKKGRLIWFASCKAAQRKADALNRRITGPNTAPARPAKNQGITA